jgi:hypothetical protein
MHAMPTAIALDVKCADFLKDNPHVYAIKARRKKIALISVEAANTQSAHVRLLLADSKLVAGGQTYKAESPTTIIRRFSEFTWDFLLYAIFAFHPVLAAVDIFFLLTGPFYNRRLRKQLESLSDGEVLLKPGERKKVLIGFQGVSMTPEQLQLAYCSADGKNVQVQCEIAR